MTRLHSLTRLVTQPSAEHLVLLVVLVVVGLAAVWILAHVSVATVFAVGLGSEIFSSNWKYLGIPIPLDRVFFVVGLLILVFSGGRAVSDRRITFRPIHLLLLATAGWATASAIGAGTIGTSPGFFALLDRLGLLPFLMFALAPLIFGDARRRNTLLIVLVVVGFYLGSIGVAEGLGIHRLVIPSYINNPNIGIHAERARGPFLEADAMGFGLYVGAVGAAIGLGTWRSHRAQVICVLTLVLDGLGIFFTVTRAVWLGAALGVVVAFASHRRLRRLLVPMGIAGAAVVALSLLLVPGLSNKVDGRVSSASPVWDRYNTNDAAIRAAEAHPVTGIGWQTFESSSTTYLRQADTYPLTGADLEVHNVFLSHLAELGVPGAVMWALALFAAVGGACLRRAPPGLEAWRLGLRAFFVMFLFIALFAPLSDALPNLFLWLMAGIVSVERHSRLREPAPSGGGARAVGATQDPSERLAVPVGAAE